jgi:F0F1-type ATP synthase beta subunit
VGETVGVAEGIVVVAAGCTTRGVFVAVGEAAGVGVELLHDELDNDMEIIKALKRKSCTSQ